MCRIEERVYIDVEGNRRSFEDTFPCDKSRKGRLCSTIHKRTTEYYPKKGVLIKRNDSPPTPINTGGTYLTQQRRPSSSSGRLSTLGGERALRPEIVIEYGSKSGKGKKYSSVSVGQPAENPNIHGELEGLGHQFPPLPVTTPFSNALATPGHASSSCGSSSSDGENTSERGCQSTRPTDYSSRALQSEVGVKAELNIGVNGTTTEHAGTDAIFQRSSTPIIESAALENDVDIYSEAGSLDLDGREDYLSQSFAEWFLALVQQQMAGELPSHVHAVLPAMIQEFAIRIGHEGQKQSHRDLMYVAHKTSAYRSIAEMQGTCVQVEEDYSKSSKTSQAEDNDQDHNRNAGEIGMSWQERVSMWSSQPDNDQAFDRPPELWDPSDTYAKYRELLKDAEATDWLISTLRRLLLSGEAVPDLMHSIRASVIKELQSCGVQTAPKISRRRNPRTYETEFQLHWNPESFCKEELLDGVSNEHLLRVITVTGNDNSFQALPCEDYITQTWPFSGPTLKTLLRSLMARPDANHKRIMRGTTASWMEACIDSEGLRMTVEGTEFEIAEVAEQLAWLAAALQSPVHTSHFISIPKLMVMSSEAKMREAATPMFRIEVSQSALPPHDLQPDKEGQCWFGLFDYMAVVNGFPVPSRDSHDLNHGLEIPLDIAAAIVGADKVVSFKGRQVLKGFSTMLYPTKVDLDGGIVVWHMLRSHGGQRLAYCDPRIGGCSDDVRKLQVSGLESARHIVGWCDNVTKITGTDNANYSIQMSDLGAPLRGWALEKIQIAAGRYIVPSFTFARSKRVRSVTTSKKERDYVGQIEWLNDKHIILHDTCDRQAWLVDGPSALLHLIRASIEADARRYSHYSKATISHAETRQSGRAASFEVLTASKFLELALRAKKDGASNAGEEDMYCVRDRAKDILHFLEQIIDHQEDIHNADEGVGVRVMRSPWNHLLGFDFIDIARRSDPCLAKGVQLKEDGEAWVPFTRAVKAVTLFGQGFGDLLRPFERTHLCGRCLWNNGPPKGRDILAVSMSDLEHLHLDVPQWKEWDHDRGGLRRVLHNLVWEEPHIAFTACACKSHHSACARLQRFKEPSTSIFARPRSTSVTSVGTVSRTGAILMGVNRNVLLKASPYTRPGALLSPYSAADRRNASSASSIERTKNLSTSGTNSSDPLDMVDMERSTQATSLVTPPLLTPRSQSPKEELESMLQDPNLPRPAQALSAFDMSVVLRASRSHSPEEELDSMLRDPDFPRVARSVSAFDISVIPGPSPRYAAPIPPPILGHDAVSPLSFADRIPGPSTQHVVPIPPSTSGHDADSPLSFANRQRSAVGPFLSTHRGVKPRLKKKPRQWDLANRPQPSQTRET